MRFLPFLLLCVLPAPALAQKAVLLAPARVFDGPPLTPHAGWVVLVRGERIEAVEGDPTQDIRALRRVRRVMKGGERYR